jgi:pimeloyl-ACP methyl ester carboxylesterase
VVLLPGMDGTGDLFGPLIASFPSRFEPIVVRYPTAVHSSSTDLLARIASAYPAGRTILIAESFSGSLAIRFAAEHPQRVKTLVLCNAFIRPPVPAITRVIPWSTIFRLPPNAWAVRRFLLGPNASLLLVEHVRRAIRQVEPGVLAARLRAILSEDCESAAARLNVPVLYLRGAQDALVGTRAVSTLMNTIRGVTLSEISGPHLLLQANPEQCWAEIQRFAG